MSYNWDKIEDPTVREYMKRKFEAEAEVNKAQELKDVTSYANIAGSALNDYANAGKGDVILRNRMQDLGKEPSVIEAKKNQYKDYGTPIADTNLGDAKDKFNKVGSGFKEEYEVGQMSRNLSEQKRADASRLEEDNPESGVSDYYRKLAKQMLPKMNFDGMSATKLKNDLPILEKMYQIDQNRLIRQESAAQRIQDRLDAKEVKRQEKAKLSDKHVEGINDFDNSINQMQGVLQNLGDRSNWVGLADGAVPDFAVGGEQAAFRSSLGRMKDAYRKLITGAGASNTELKKLESRLPSEYDTYEQFQAKAADFLREVNKSRETHLQNLQRNGKSVDEFASPVDTGRSQSQTKPSWAK